MAIDNGLSVEEESIELRAPLVQDKAAIKSLVAAAGFRRSDYSVSGQVNTYKFDLQYAPIPDVRLRASYNRAIRAPNIIELYNPQLIGKITFGADPCAPTVDTTNTIRQGTAGQLSQLQGGNPQLKAETTPLAGARSYDCAGLYGFTCQTINPRWHHILRTTWPSPWDLSATLTWRCIRSVAQDNNNSQPALHFSTWNGYDYYNDLIASYDYLDLAAIWTHWKNLELRGGINNLFDKDPPLVTTEIVSGGAANTYETYDGLGRQLFVAFSAKF